MLLTSPYELKVRHAVQKWVGSKEWVERYRWLGDGKRVYGFTFC